jgi:Lon protease-like protein
VGREDKMAPAPGRPFTLAELPATLPVFPLPGVLLLPRGRLPLNIFEPRYVAMFDDALCAPDRLIGMIQPIQPEMVGPQVEGPEIKPPALYRTGCAGRIVSMSETEDGRYLITLLGISRFNIAAEVEGRRGYRRVTPDFAAWAGDLERTATLIGDRKRLIGALKTYFRINHIEADWDGIEETSDDKLLTTLAMVCPFDPSEKQALLECKTCSDRAKAMTTLLEMAALPGCDDRAKH